MLVGVVLRMLGAQREIYKTITVTSKPKSRMQMHKCLWDNLSERRNLILPSFMTLWWMNKDDLFVYFGQMLDAGKTIVFLGMWFR